MTMLQFVLTTLIRNGKVTVETPGLDMDELRQAVWNRAAAMLDEIQDIVYEEEMTDTEKVEWIRRHLEYQ